MNVVDERHQVCEVAQMLPDGLTLAAMIHS
jgi:hypothetical protein